MGRYLVQAVGRQGDVVRVMSTRRRVPSDPANVEWAQADLGSGEGIPEAMADVEAVFHLASNPADSQTVDVNGTGRLVEAARAAGVSHLVFVSIVGIDEIPIAFYSRKREAEHIVETSGLPYSIQRVTQFHSFVDALLSKLARLPFIMPLPANLKFQPVDESEIAERLARTLRTCPRGRLIDLGGPEVLTLRDMAETWLAAKSLQKKLVPVPVTGKAARALKAGKNTVKDGVLGTIAWDEWLERRYERQAAESHKIARWHPAR